MMINIKLDAIPLNFNSFSSSGSMYVIVGVTLGGHVIYKKLKNNINFSSKDFSFNYYNVYKKSLMPKLLSFIDALNSVQPEQHELVISGAMQMFENIALISKRVTGQSDLR